MIPELRAFLDEKGRLTSLPSKYKKQLAAVWYLDAWHTFHDPAALRRYLTDLGLMTRERDGSRYRRADTLPSLAEFLGRNI